MPVFLLTDIEKSTRLWEDHPEAMKPALESCGIPTGASIEDLDVHMLKDLEVSIRLFSLTHPDLVLKEFPPLKTLSNRPNNLPPQITPFIASIPYGQVPA